MLHTPDSSCRRVFPVADDGQEAFLRRRIAFLEADNEDLRRQVRELENSLALWDPSFALRMERQRCDSSA